MGVGVQCNVQDIQVNSLEPMYLSPTPDEDSRAWDDLRRQAPTSSYEPQWFI